ncbi:recq-mediated genome instability protein 1 [Plakobranchus ocellatus]|uniref:RecQ-mediated genome instability protein 1 n=1 Tax=Plakobranchus ocellatus TaxID=259542 RepID=A0AAV4B0Y7_9GAST|nr:recq-mediated genome instability protein 1 [Plakobranchus ocellatus]
MEHFTTVQTWLINSYNIQVSQDWLSACLEWIAQENEGQVLSVDTARQQVFEQWLTSDLTEIGEPSLPVDVQTCDKMELVSNYALQILSVVDVGFPLYGQQQKLVGRENVNAQVSADKPFQPAWEPKPSRMLVLCLTDGHTEIKAMEYQPIRSLHSQVPSGAKCLLSGTMLCRQGMILLSEEHFHLLGGEVDTLAEMNTPLAVLQQAMVKNREDEGRHARQTFSGKFISRGSNKKMPLQMKSSVVKRDGPAVNSQRNFKGSNQCEIKRESKPIETSFLAGLKTDMKIEPDLNSYRHHQNFDEEWGEDINYDELFDDDMDLDDGMSICPDNSRDGSNKSTTTSNNKYDKTFSGRTNRLAGKRVIATTITNDVAALRDVQSSLPSQDDLNFFDDDDMDMEDVFDDSCPTWKPNLQHQPPLHNNKKNITLKQDSPFTVTPGDKTTIKTDVSAQPKHAMKKPGSMDWNSSSPLIPYQGDSNTEVKPVCASPTFTSPTSLSNKKPIFKVEQPSMKQKVALSTSANQAKKPKVQAKVTELFRKHSTVVNKDAREKEPPQNVHGSMSDYLSCISQRATSSTVLPTLNNGGSISSKPLTSTHSHSKPLLSPHNHSKPLSSPHNPSKPLSSSHNHSKPLSSPHNHSKTLSSPHNYSKPLSSPHNHSKPVPSPHSQGKPDTREAGMKTNQDGKSVPKAVIQPFQPANSETETSKFSLCLSKFY